MFYDCCEKFLEVFVSLMYIGMFVVITSGMKAANEHACSEQVVAEDIEPEKMNLVPGEVFFVSIVSRTGIIQFLGGKYLYNIEFFVYIAI